MKKIFLPLLIIISYTIHAQNVGIGTTAPDTKLTISTTGSAFGLSHTNGTVTVKTFVSSSMGQIGTYSNHPFQLMANDLNGQFTLMPNGLIGIANAAPTLAGFTVDNEVGNVNAIFGSKSTGIALENNYPGIGFNSYYSSGRKFMAAGFGGVIGYNPTSGYFTFASSLVTGIAGAAATTPASLTISPKGLTNTTTPTASYGFTHTDGTVTIATYVGVPTSGGLGGWIGTSTNHPLYFFTNGNTASKMILSQAGDLSVDGGVTAYAHTTQVSATALNATATGGTGHNTGVYAFAEGATSNIGVSAYADGGSGCYAVYALAGDNSTWAGYFSGNVFTNGTYQTSDERLKTNIVSYDESAVSTLKKFTVKKYTFRQDGDYKKMHMTTEPQVGIMAADIKKEFPQLVKTTASPVMDENTHKLTGKTIEFDAVNYTGLVPILVKGMQEQQQQIEELKAEVEALKALIKK